MQGSSVFPVSRLSSPLLSFCRALRAFQAAKRPEDMSQRWRQAMVDGALAGAAEPSQLVEEKGESWRASQRIMD